MGGSKWRGGLAGGSPKAITSKRDEQKREIEGQTTFSCKSTGGSPLTASG